MLRKKKFSGKNEKAANLRKETCSAEKRKVKVQRFEGDRK
jgi:hypothetical protein